MVVGQGIKRMDEIMMRTSKYDKQEMENYKVRGWKIVVVGQGIKEDG